MSGRMARNDGVAYIKKNRPGGLSGPVLPISTVDEIRY